MIKNWIIAILVLLTLSGCTGEQCIEADDFGHSVISVPARYAKAEFNGQVGANQVAPWIESGYRVNGRPLTMVVKGWDYGVDRNTVSEVSAWCAWYGASADGRKLNNFCERLRDCQFTDDHMCTNTADARITNAPCLFRNGVGLYALIGEHNTDPNLTLGTQRDPSGISMHLGEPNTGYSLYDLDKNGNSRVAGGRVYLYASDAVKQQYSDSLLYFKILDKFYDDNSGQYKVIVKSGISRANPDPISYVTMLVKQFLFGIQGHGEQLLPGLKASNADGIFDGNGGVIKSLYMGVVGNPGYQTAVSAMLTLFIIFTALSYLAGNVQLTHTELIVRVGKIAIVSALLSSEYSWSFFNDYLFVYFIGGVEQILGMIEEAGATGPGSSGILALMIAPQTISKVLSLLFVDALGWLYIILFVIALYFVVMVYFEFAVLYLTALIAIGMIIIMGPIFICFMLFGITKSLFENWLKQLISYAVQPIILFTGITFMSVIISTEMYGSLGFKVCKQSFPKLTTTPELITQATEATLGFNPGQSIFYWWFPKPMKGEQFSKNTVKMPIPIDHMAKDNETGEIRDGFCEAYGCIGDRYVDLPFLDPVDDQRRITQFHSGKFVQLDGLLLIFVALYLLSKFNGLAISAARFITGTSGNYTQLQNVGDAVHSQTFAKMNASISAVPSRLGQAATNEMDGFIGRRALRSSGKDLSKMSAEERNKLAIKTGKEVRSQYSPSARVDKYRVHRLKKEATTSGANKAVLAEVQKNTGMKQSDVNPDAMKNYRAALAEKLEDMGMPKEKSEQTAKQLSKKRPDQLRDELSKAQFGKKYNDLSVTEKANIKHIHDTKLRALSRDSDKARTFRKAYVDAYAAMSDRGVGIAGKHVKTIRSLEEIRHDTNERQRVSKTKELQRGEEIYSAVEGVKKSAFTALGGKKQGSTFGRTFAGGAYHDINSGDPRKMTQAELLAENKQSMQRAAITKNIESYNKQYGESVISPEFLAKAEKTQDPNLGTFRTLEKRQVKASVQEALRSNEETASMGDSYLSDYAKDSEPLPKNSPPLSKVIFITSFIFTGIFERPLNLK